MSSKFLSQDGDTKRTAKNFGRGDDSGRHGRILPVGKKVQRDSERSHIKTITFTSSSSAYFHVLSLSFPHMPWSGVGMLLSPSPTHMTLLPWLCPSLPFSNRSAKQCQESHAKSSERPSCSPCLERLQRGEASCTAPTKAGCSAPLATPLHQAPLLEAGRVAYPPTLPPPTPGG